ncbi:MAG: rhomboid family intramembrane serine protease [Gammaproteobacteria bacterium]|nr:rhomboid family intramembrane serine protease [Gammaproteobacteria bacterium]
MMEQQEPISSSYAKNDTWRLRRSLLLSVLFVAVLWSIKLTDVLLGLNLIQYGIYPGELSGLWGILWAPLIHGSVQHLIANTLPVIILLTTLLYGYPKSARIVLLCLYVGTGVGVWLFARSAYHIGASSLTFGLMFFIFTIGALRWDKRAIALSSMVFFLYGGMVWGVLPRDPTVSFESHFFSAVIGIVLAFILKNIDSPLPEKKYRWEGEDEMEQDEIREEEWNLKE